jgi:acetyl-CoA carboxylase carboxyl transferase subunit alpha
MLENAIYSVITPEGCAAIRWKDAGKKQQAAAALRYTATDVKMLGCVDDVIQEPEGGTHNDPALAISLVNDRLVHHLGELKRQSIDDLIAARYNKFRNMAQFYTSVASV